MKPIYFLILMLFCNNAFSALPDPSSLDYGYLKSGPFSFNAAKTTVDTTTLDYGYLKTGPFVGYQPASAAGTSFSFGVIIGLVTEITIGGLK